MPLRASTRSRILRSGSLKVSLRKDEARLRAAPLSSFLNPGSERTRSIWAAACGVPSVVWDYAGPREVVVDGVTGYRARPYFLDDYVEKHARLLGDEGLRVRMGAAARRRVSELFTWERHVDGLVKAIEAST